MKKILALLLALVMVFALTACGQPKGPLLVMGNSDVPVGQYTQKILAYYGLDEEALAKAGKITYGTNVKEVTTQVKEGSVNCRSALRLLAIPSRQPRPPRQKRWSWSSSPPRP